jgi:hypothetical protein
LTFFWACRCKNNCSMDPSAYHLPPEKWLNF